MNHIFVEAIIISIVAIVIFLVIFLTKKVSSIQKKNPDENINAIISILEDAARISKEWNLGSLCLSKSHLNDACFLLSFELGPDDLDKIETILHYEHDSGWEVFHPGYSALPIFAREFAINQKSLRTNFYELLENAVAKSHPEWQIVTNNSVRIICF